MSNDKKIQDTLKEVEGLDLDSLRNAFIHETDSNKQNLLNALYTYALRKKQDEIIDQKKFVM